MGGGGWCLWVPVQTQSLSPAGRLPYALGGGEPYWPYQVLFKDTLLLNLPCLILFPDA